MRKLTRTVCELLDRGERLVLATVLSRAGSAPRAPGARMVVRANGSIAGTVGGGLVEAEVIRAAGELFGGSGFRIRAFDLAGSTSHAEDAICGGRLEILLGLIEACDRNRDLFHGLADALKAREPCLLVTALGLAESDSGELKLSVAKGGKPEYGDFPYPASWIARLEEAGSQGKWSQVAVIEGHRFLVEPCGAPGTVFLFGAGHVSRPVAALAHLVGFQTVVLDDRAEFANRERFPAADEVCVLDSFEHAFRGLELDRNSYVVIVTRGHSHDRTVLTQALRSPAGYIGMIGSRRKRDAIYEALMRQEGFGREELERVHCPVGLSIGAESPDEIAVSIVAELILARAGAAPG
ncbi:MAG: XdhC family aldehyde oxidoreductase maturation factor [bacterium]